MDGKKILAGPLRLKINWCGLFFLSILFFCTCKNQNQEKQNLQTTNKPQDDSLPADFIEFYNKFHLDSLYQMEHIVFPLKGVPDHADPEDIKENEFYFTADQWIIHRKFDPSKNKIEYLILNPIIIEERIIEKEHQLMVIRRFAKTSGGWNLIYYAGINKYKIGEE
jgi:hypothetical protein